LTELELDELELTDDWLVALERLELLLEFDALELESRS
jgi:hypothetical protein